MLLLLTVAVWAQPYSSRSRQAVRQMDRALDCLEKMDLPCAEESLRKALKADPAFIEALQLLAQVYYDQGRLEEAIPLYRKSLELAPGEDPRGSLTLARLTLLTGDYAQALEAVNRYLSLEGADAPFSHEALRLKRNCLFALEAMEHPVPFSPENLGDSVNSPYNEYWPSLSVDESVLMFTVMLPVPEAGEGSRRFQEDLYLSTMSEGGWTGRINAGPPLNSADNEGAQSITADGRVLYFTACNRHDGKGQCDIYRSEKQENGWSIPENLGAPVNSRYSEKHPAVSADGRMLYFASDRPGGKGSLDLWVSRWTGEQWSEPVNLGDSVNTPLKEQSPFIHPDQQSLYFSSDGWTGMGQGDLFLTTLDASGGWKEPQNLGYPINTYNDEIGLTVSASGDRAFFASDRDEGGDTDLYTFPLPEQVRPVPVSYVAGRVTDSQTGRGLAARLELIDLDTDTVVMQTGTRQGDGSYLLSLPAGRQYALNVTSEGYLFYSGHFSLGDAHTRMLPFRRDVPLDRVEVGSRVVLNNVFFDLDSDRLRPESRVELDRVAEFLDIHQGVEVEIGGHTDNTGTSAYNQALSERRAEAVAGYLVSRGIEPARITWQGYGDRQPAAENDTESGRAMNRRTELRILQIHPN